MLLAIAAMMPQCLLSDECDYSDSYCDGTVLHTCGTENNMFRTSTWNVEDCAAMGRVCVSGYDDSWGHTRWFCAQSANKDPRCDEPGPGWRCDGNNLLGCSAGYLVTEGPCDPKVCAPLLNGTGASDCLDPESPCFDPEIGHAWTCDGNDAYLCKDRKVSMHEHCPGCTLNEEGAPVSGASLCTH